MSLAWRRDNYTCPCAVQVRGAMRNIGVCVFIDLHLVFLGFFVGSCLVYLFDSPFVVVCIFVSLFWKFYLCFLFGCLVLFFFNYLSVSSSVCVFSVFWFLSLPGCFHLFVRLPVAVPFVYLLAALFVCLFACLCLVGWLGASMDGWMKCQVIYITVWLLHFILVLFYIFLHFKFWIFNLYIVQFPLSFPSPVFLTGFMYFTLVFIPVCLCLAFVCLSVRLAVCVLGCLLFPSLLSYMSNFLPIFPTFPYSPQFYHPSPSLLRCQHCQSQWSASSWLTLWGQRSKVKANSQGECCYHERRRMLLIFLFCWIKSVHSGN